MNRGNQLLQFLLKDYPAYFWSKPSLRRAILFPILLVDGLIRGFNHQDK